MTLTREEAAKHIEDLKLEITESTRIFNEAHDRYLAESKAVIDKFGHIPACQEGQLDPLLSKMVETRGSMFQISKLREEAYLELGNTYRVLGKNPPPDPNKWPQGCPVPQLVQFTLVGTEDLVDLEELKDETGKSHYKKLPGTGKAFLSLQLNDGEIVRAEIPYGHLEGIYAREHPFDFDHPAAAAVRAEMEEQRKRFVVWVLRYCFVNKKSQVTGTEFFACQEKLFNAVKEYQVRPEPVQFWATLAEALGFNLCEELSLIEQTLLLDILNGRGELPVIEHTLLPDILGDRLGFGVEAIMRIQLFDIEKVPGLVIRSQGKYGVAVDATHVHVREITSSDDVDSASSVEDVDGSLPASPAPKDRSGAKKVYANGTESATFRVRFAGKGIDINRVLQLVQSTCLDARLGVTVVDIEEIVLGPMKTPRPEGKGPALLVYETHVIVHGVSNGALVRDIFRKAWGSPRTKSEEESCEMLSALSTAVWFQSTLTYVYLYKDGSKVPTLEKPSRAWKRTSEGVWVRRKKPGKAV